MCFTVYLFFCAPFGVMRFQVPHGAEILTNKSVSTISNNMQMDFIFLFCVTIKPIKHVPITMYPIIMFLV